VSADLTVLKLSQSKLALNIKFITYLYKVYYDDNRVGVLVVGTALASRYENMSHRSDSQQVKNKLMKRIVVTLIGASVLAAFQVGANPVTVQEMGVGNNEIVNITSSTLGTASVYAGIINLQINGVASQGFCIDPFDWSVGGPQNYSMVPLTQAPKPPGGPLDDATATKIEQLWAHSFAAATVNPADAAGLQIAIWELVSSCPNAVANGATFHLNSADDYGAGDLLNWVNSTPDAPVADLVGLTGPGQDYVVQNVPDGGTTMILLGSVLLGIIIAQRKLSIAKA
jgi:hypothetical protein